MEEKKEKLTSVNIDKINDKIYLGDIVGANEIEYLKQEGITHIISLAGDFCSPKYEDGLFIRKIINIDDFGTENIYQYFKECIEFIENSDKVFIHCSCGVDRSPTIIIGYLMWKTHSSYDDVFNYIKEKRNCIEPNNLSVIKLHKLDSLLRKNNYQLEKIDMK